jgi:hypothetical protein
MGSTGPSRRAIASIGGTTDYVFCCFIGISEKKEKTKTEFEPKKSIPSGCFFTFALETFCRRFRVLPYTPLICNFLDPLAASTSSALIPTACYISREVILANSGTS